MGTMVGEKLRALVASQTGRPAAAVAIRNSWLFVDVIRDHFRLSRHLDSLVPVNAADFLETDETRLAKLPHRKPSSPLI